MTEGLIPDCDHATGCITCGDEAIRMRVVHIDGERELALCEVEEGGGRSTVEIALVQPVVEDDVLLVHAGTAIARAESGVAAWR
ncbi:MAG TPA: HypC/HybG/HupF family hydrogenase formation chaperone [Solirubrobacterales bacterium]|jgi:hydrogenase maturation factor|nr:HypC/HybG/HupF family hydrogenase formation chaperone [Solirubrobacterales bacterium]